jgi:hypothetical protein
MDLHSEQMASTSTTPTTSIAPGRPRVLARTAVVFYLLEGGTSVFSSIFVHDKLTVSGNAAATGASVLAHQPLLWAGFAAALVAVVCHTVYTFLFYALLKPVSRTLSLIAAAISIVGIAVQGCATTFQVAPLLILRGGSYLDVFTVSQRNALALLSLQLNAQTFGIYLYVFGCWLMLISVLIFHSGFIPQFVGVMVALGALSNVVHLSPSLVNYLYPYYLIPDLGELALLVLLFTGGVNVTRWNQLAERRG